MFLIKWLKSPNIAFDINNHISFASGNTRLAASNKLQHNRNPKVLTIATSILIEYLEFGMHYPLLIMISVYPQSRRNLQTNTLKLILI